MPYKVNDLGLMDTSASHLSLSLTIRWRMKLMSNISIATTRRLSIILVLLDKYSFIIKLTFLVVCNCD